MPVPSLYWVAPRCRVYKKVNREPRVVTATASIGLSIISSCVWRCSNSSSSSSSILWPNRWVVSEQASADKCRSSRRRFWPRSDGERNHMVDSLVTRLLRSYWPVAVTCFCLVDFNEADDDNLMRHFKRRNISICYGSSGFSRRRKTDPDSRNNLIAISNNNNIDNNSKTYKFKVMFCSLRGGTL